MGRDRAASPLMVFSHGARLGRVIGLISLFVFQLWGCGSGNSGPQQANFSDYYPLTKGTYRVYTVTTPGSPLSTITEVMTSGATYNGLSSVRTCRSPLSWADDALSNSRVTRLATIGDGLSFSFPMDPLSVPPGTIPPPQGLQPIGPFTLGLDGWIAGNSETSTPSVFLTSTAPPVALIVTVTFQGLETVTVGTQRFEDTMKIDFSEVLPSSFLIGQLTVTRTEWYARGLGLVKSIRYGNDFSGALQLLETWELADHGTLSSPPPKLLSISPAVGPPEGGTTVMLTGELFSPGAEVTIGTAAATSVIVESPTVVRAVTPVGRFSPADVMVVNADCQTSILEDAFTFQ